MQKLAYSTVAQMFRNKTPVEALPPEAFGLEAISGTHQVGAMVVV